MQRRQLMSGAGLGILALALPGAALPGSAEAADADLTGAWYITVHVEHPTPAQFDALYGFANGGMFVRIDGRNNAPAVGEWKRVGDTIVMSNLLFSFDPVTGMRIGTITGHFQATVAAGVMSGTFSALGTAPDGSPLTGFPKSGTFTGTPIRAQAP
jgi:hypothetical protein